MAYTSPTIEKTGAREPWKPRGVRGVPFISWFSFSSKSPFSYDNWGRDIKRPYQLVLMPGYQAPKMTSSLSKDCDFVWFERPVKKPTIVWDGFDPYALMEIAYECFRSDIIGPYFRVRDAQSGDWIDDPRDKAFLATRPKRDFPVPDPSVEPGKYQLANRDHRRRLARWVYDGMVASNKRCANSGINPSYDKEVKAWSALNDIYGASLSTQRSHPDDLARNSNAERRLRANPERSFMDPPGYKSPLRFSEMDVERSAHRAFAPASQEVSQVAQRRVEARKKAIQSIPSTKSVEADTSVFKKIFSKLF